MNDLSQLETIFFAALNRTAPEERMAFLNDACGDDRQLRRRVEAMLTAQSQAGSFLESPPVSLAGSSALDPPPREQPGTVIGPYTLVDVLAEGGMGVVYVARQSEPVTRRVALKIIKPGLDTRQVIGRFESERRALAIIDHPNVAKVLDAGVTRSGRPYFVMELIDGVPITQFCDEHRFDLRERLALLLPVCHAVQHAHQKGIIHRDLKPSNVMVAVYDDRPVPKVIDFGVAKAIGSALTDESLITQYGQVVGTLEYMSPEQASFDQLDVDTRSDIYSLGVLLYELLTGTTPLRRARQQAMALDALLRVIREEEPSIPSKQLNSGDTLPEVAAQRGTEAVRLTRLVRGELDWIVMKALEKDRARRYESASALAADIERYLRDEPVAARPPALGYTVRKFTWRHRVAVAATMMTLTGLLSGLGLAVWQAVRARDAQLQAEGAQRVAEGAQQQLAERYRIAQESVDTYLLRVTQDERLDHPGLRQLRQQLLEAALPYYDQLHQLVPTDNVSRAARATALQQLGRVQQELGRFDASRAALEEAAQLFDQLAAAHPDEVTYRGSLADVLVQLADHYRTRGATGDMREYELQALELREQLAAAEPDDDVSQLALAQSYTNLGVATPGDEGQALLEQALQIWQALADRSPETPLYREYLSLGYQNLARRFAWDRAEQALPFQQRAAELCAQLAHEQPDAKRTQIRWARSEQYLADTLEILSGRLDEARAHREESLRILRDYLAKHPQWPEVRAGQARMQDLLAHTLQEQGELELAQASAQTAIGLWEQLVSEIPDVVEYEGGLASAQRTLGAVQVAQGQATAGLELLTQARDRLQRTLERIGPHDPSDELLRSVQQALADTRRLLGQDRSATLDDELHEFKRRESRQAAGEALRPSKFLAGLSSLQTHGLRAGGEAPILTRTAQQEQTMVRLPEQRSRSTSRRAQHTRRRPVVEQLESRQLLTASISVADATLNEIGSPSAFITSGSGGLDGPKDITIGPDGNLYVASAANASVIRYNTTTGQLIGTFVTSGSGQLSNPSGIAFGPDGHLYVVSYGSNRVNRYHGTTGAFLDTYLPTGTIGMDYPVDATFGPDGNLYVTNRYADSVSRYAGPLDASPGSPLPAPGQTDATFVPAGSGGLDEPLQLTFGPNGDLYVGSGNGRNQDQIVRFNGGTGAWVDSFGDNSHGPVRGMTFDAEGRLCVADPTEDLVRRYDPAGNVVDDLMPTSVSGVRPFGLAFDPIGNLLISGESADSVLRYTSGVLVSLSEASASPVSVTYAMSDGTATPGTDYTHLSGTIVFAPGQTERRILLAARDDVVLESTESFAINLSDPTGGTTLADDSATVSIVDDDSLRTISVTDSTATEGDHTPHYRGAFVQTNPGKNFNSLTFGPDGHLYTSEGPGPTVASIDRYDGTTGAFIDHFIPAGKIDGVRDMVFQGDFLYIGSEYTDEILRFSAASGVPAGISGIPGDAVFVAADAPILDGPHGMTSGPDANGDLIPELYVTGLGQNLVRYDGATGARHPVTFATSGAGALSSPQGLTVSPDGNIYVASTGSNKIQKYNPLTGAFLGTISNAALVGPKDVKFGSDGLLYVASSGNDRILRFSQSGEFIDDYVPAGAGGMDNTHRLAFGPDEDLYVVALGTGQILRFGPENEALVTVTISKPSSLPLTVDYATTNGSAVAGSDYATTSGTVTFEPGVTSKIIRVPILDDAVAEPTETFTVTLSSAVGATIADGTGVGTILDNDPFTKFYVVNDATTDRTYEYGETGVAVENYALGTGNTAPRGAASTAAGTNVWVVDANKKVYIYDTSGALVGSWTAGGLQSNAALQGIATDGTDIWLIDAQTDRVYRYTGAAALTSGSQNAASSFGLNSGNTNSKDIVTDGTYLWTVNDSTSDYVFKYTVAGTYVGKWKISTSGAKAPTGITLDPSSPAHIWIVDSGTDRVYQYDNAASLTSGSKSANGNFVLSSGNTNPQGIADPPPPGALLLDDALAPMTSPRAAAVDLALLQGLAMSRADSIAAPWLRSTSRAASSAPRRWTAEEMLPVLPGAPSGLPRHTPRFEAVRHQHALGQALDELLADWESDMLHDVLLP